MRAELRKKRGHRRDTMKLGAIKPGDTILLVEGAGFGSRIVTGKAYGLETNRWGTSLRVKREDGGFEWVESVQEYEPGARAIGAYWVPDSPIRD